MLIEIAKMLLLIYINNYIIFDFNISIPKIKWSAYNIII